MCKFVKNVLKIVAVLAAIAGIFAIVFHFLQKKDAMVDETIDSLDEREEEIEEEVAPELPKPKKFSYYSKEARDKRNYIKLPFHEA